MLKAQPNRRLSAQMRPRHEPAHLLHIACAQGLTWMAQEMLDSGADVNGDDDLGDKPLHRAAKGGWLEVVELLLERGADVNARSFYGDTPLHRAVMGGNVGVMKLLLQHGADPQARDERGWTPLDAVALARDGHKEIGRCLSSG